MKIKFNTSILHGDADTAGKFILFEAGKVYDVAEDLAKRFMTMEHTNVFVPKFDEDVARTEKVFKAEAAAAEAQVEEAIQVAKTPAQQTATSAVDKLVEGLAHVVHKAQAPAAPVQPQQPAQQETVVDAATQPQN